MPRGVPEQERARRAAPGPHTAPQENTSTPDVAQLARVPYTLLHDGAGIPDEFPTDRLAYFCAGFDVYDPLTNLQLPVLSRNNVK